MRQDRACKNTWLSIRPSWFFNFNFSESTTAVLGFEKVSKNGAGNVELEIKGMYFCIFQNPLSCWCPRLNNSFINLVRFCLFIWYGFDWITALHLLSTRQLRRAKHLCILKREIALTNWLVRAFRRVASIIKLNIRLKGETTLFVFY